ncbi:hypothetical protein ACQY0O_001816 [Thecaphora frezii]
MSHLPRFDELRLYASHPSTRLTHPPPSSSTTTAASRPFTSTTTTAASSAATHVHLLSTRRSHLPALPSSASLASTSRSLHGYPPLFTTMEADQLSDLEESLDLLKDSLVRFGDRHIVQIGRRRTLHEQDLSDDDHDDPRPNASAHHFNEQAQAQRSYANEQEVGEVPLDAEMHMAEQRIREAEARASRAAAVANAARSTAQRQAAIQMEQDAVDLDADVEDLDADQEGDDDVDYDD